MIKANLLICETNNYRAYTTHVCVLCAINYLNEYYSRRERYPPEYLGQAARASLGQLVFGDVIRQLFDYFRHVRKCFVPSGVV